MEKSGTDQRTEQKAKQALFGRAVAIYYKSLVMARDAFEAAERARVAIKDEKGRLIIPKLPDPTGGLFLDGFAARMRPFVSACETRNIDLE